MALVTAKDIVTIGFKGSNSIDENHFTERYIETVELTYLRPYFPQVFDNIIAKAGVGYTANEQLLVTKMQHPLILFCKHDIIPELSLGLDNAGVQSFGSEFSTPVSSNERKALQVAIMQHAEVEMDQVIRFYEEEDDLTGEETEVSNDFNGDVVL